MFRWSAVQMNFSKQSGFFSMLRSSEFQFIFHKNAGSGFESGSEIKVKVGSGSGNNNFGSTTLSKYKYVKPSLVSAMKRINRGRAAWRSLCGGPDRSRSTHWSTWSMSHGLGPMWCTAAWKFRLPASMSRATSLAPQSNTLPARKPITQQTSIDQEAKAFSKQTGTVPYSQSRVQNPLFDPE